MSDLFYVLSFGVSLKGNFLKKNFRFRDKGVSSLLVIITVALIVVASGSLLIFFNEQFFGGEEGSDRGGNKPVDNYSQEVYPENEEDNLISDTGEWEENNYEQFEIPIGDVKEGESATVDLNSYANFLGNVEMTFSTGVSDLKIYLRKRENTSSSQEVSFEEGKVFEYFGLSANVSDISIEKVSISFSVPTYWIESNNLEKEISLLRYQDGWEKLKTRFVREEDNECYFTAEASGLYNFSAAYLEKGEQLTPLEESEGKISDTLSFEVNKSSFVFQSFRSLFYASEDLLGKKVISDA